MRYKIKSRNRRKGISLMRKGEVTGMYPTPRQIAGDPTDHPIYTPLAPQIVPKRRKKKIVLDNDVSRLPLPYNDDIEYDFSNKWPESEIYNEPEFDVVPNPPSFLNLPARPAICDISIKLILLVFFPSNFFKFEK